MMKRLPILIWRRNQSGNAILDKMVTAKNKKDKSSALLAITVAIGSFAWVFYHLYTQHAFNNVCFLPFLKFPVPVSDPLQLGTRTMETVCRRKDTQ